MSRRRRHSCSSSSSSSDSSVQDRTPDDTSHDVANILKNVYSNVAVDTVTVGCTQLWKVYVKDRDDETRRSEFIAEIAHRTRLFLEGAQHLKMQLHVLHTLAMLINKCVAEGENTILEEITNVVYEKRNTTSLTVRSTTCLFTGQLLQYSLKSVESLDENEFPSTFGKEGFTKLYQILIDVCDIDDEITRKVVVSALQHFQDIPRLMEDILNPLFHAKHVICVGLFDPSEVVRIASVKALDVTTQKDGRYMLEVLVRDPSPAIRQLVATEISVRVPLGVFLLDDVRTVFNDKGIFLGDYVVSEYFDLLLSWAKDTYCSLCQADPDAHISPEHLFEGIFYFLKMMAFTKDMHPVTLRMFHRMRCNFQLDEVKFVRAFVDSTLISINSLNFTMFFSSMGNIEGENFLLSSLSGKLRRVVMWFSMVEYMCSHAVPEPIRLETKLLLLPSMSEHAHVFISIWREFGQLAQNVQSNYANVLHVMNTIVLFLVKVYEYLESDEIGKAEFAKIIPTVLSDTSFPATREVVAAVVKNWLIHQLNTLTDPDHAINIVTDFVHDLNNADSQINSTQEMFHVNDSYMDETQISQNPPVFQQRPNADPVLYARIVQVLASVVSSGAFKIRILFLKALSEAFGAEVDEDICTALASGFSFLDIATYLEVQRQVFEGGHRRIFRVCLIMLCESIMVQGLKKTNELYFATFDSTTPSKPDAIDLKGNVENLFLHFLDDQDTSFVCFNYRCILQFIMFDYDSDFKESMKELLLRTFRPNMDHRITLLLRQFWVHFCSLSREHQCRMAAAYVAAMKKLTVCELDAPIAKVDKDDLTEFVLDVTAYGCLRPNAIDRDLGTAHVFLADKLFTVLLQSGDDTIVSDVIMSALTHCEISDVVDHTRLKLLEKAAAKAAHNSENKSNFELLEKRYRTVLNHIRTNHIPTVVLPNISPNQLDKELRSILARCTSHNERKYCQPWLDISEDGGHAQLVTSRTAVENGDPILLDTSTHETLQPASSKSKKNAPTKMKIWHERNVTFEQLKAKYLRIRKYVNSEAPQTILRSRRFANWNNNATPVSSANTSASELSSIQTGSQRGTPINRRRLVPITEQPEVATIFEED